MQIDTGIHHGVDLGIFHEGVNGSFVKPGEPSELSKKIVEFLSDDNYCDQISTTTRRYAVDNYDINVIGQSLARLYKSYLPD